MHIGYVLFRLYHFLVILDNIKKNYRDIQKMMLSIYPQKDIFQNIYCGYIRKKYTHSVYIHGYTIFLDISKDISRIYRQYPGISVDIYFALGK